MSTPATPPPGNTPPYPPSGGGPGVPGNPYPSGGSSPAPGPYPGSNAPPSPPSAGGFFGALFDFSFSRFITPMIIRFVYVLATAVIAITWLFMVVAGFTDSAGLGLFMLVLGPVIALIYLAFIRMTLEIYLAVVRMSEDIHQRLPQR